MSQTQAGGLLSVKHLSSEDRRSVLMASMGTGHWAILPPCSHRIPHTVLVCVLPAPCCLLLNHCWDVRCTTCQPRWRLEGRGKCQVSGWEVLGTACSRAGVGPGRAHTLDFLGPNTADGSSDQLAFLILSCTSQLWVTGRPQVLDCAVQVSGCPAPSPALAWASPVWSALPHHSWTPAALPAAPEQPAAQPPAAESCRDIMIITPISMVRLWRMWAEGRARTGYPKLGQRDIYQCTPSGYRLA